MLWSKRLLRFRVIDDLQSIVIDLDAVRICPHLIELVITLFDHDLAIDIMLKHSNFYPIADDIVHSQVYIKLISLSLLMTP